MDNRIIYIATVQHTGTWFAIELLKAHPQVTIFRETWHLMHRGDTLPKTTPSGDRFLMHSHLDAMGEPNGDLASTFARMFSEVVVSRPIFPTLITLRDPLLSLITRQKRHPKGDHSYILRGFGRLAEIDGDWVHFLPVDIGREATREERVIMTGAALASVGLPMEENVRKYAESWAFAGQWAGRTNRRHPLNDAYDRGDIDTIAEAIPLVKDLRESENKLRPFLESHGYKNLLWWT